VKSGDFGLKVSDFTPMISRSWALQVNYGLKPVNFTEKISNMPLFQPDSGE
jgi:hypothetical protein